MKKKPYANIDAVPRELWETPIAFLRDGEVTEAEASLRPILAKIEDIKVFEVFLLVRKLSTEAGGYQVAIHSASEESYGTAKVISFTPKRS